MSNTQNLGSYLRDLGGTTKGELKQPYHQIDFEKQFKENPMIITKGDSFYDFQEKIWKIKE